jgi:hypothetical protein
MYIATVLELARLVLEITLQAMKDAPPEVKAQMWERHMKHMDRLEALADRFAGWLTPKDTDA